jgi:hypothetical protein
MSESESIRCAAIKFNGRVWALPRPKRHHDIMRFAVDNTPGAKICPCAGDDQGFLTTKGRYVTREEAGQIALASGETKELKWGDQLYSEDLW